MTTVAPPRITPIREATWRETTVVEGRIRSLRVRPWGDNPTLEVVLVDDSGGLVLVFLARRRIAGLSLGTFVRAEGVVGSHERKPVLINPRYTILPTPA